MKTDGRRGPRPRGGTRPWPRAGRHEAVARGAVTTAGAASWPTAWPPCPGSVRELLPRAEAVEEVDHPAAGRAGQVLHVSLRAAVVAIASVIRSEAAHLCSKTNAKITGVRDKDTHT